MSMGIQKQNYGDGTVGKALSVLDMVAAHDAPPRFSELLAQSDLPKATLYRLLQTLTSQQMLVYDEERGTYGLGVRLMRLAHKCWAQNSLAPIARPHIDALSQKIGETVHLAQLDHGQVLYIDKRNARIPVPMMSQAGKIGPAYCTGVGKAMLAHLPENQMERVIAEQSFHPYTPQTLSGPDALRAECAEIRAAGIAFDREEHEDGIICIAAPILSAAGHAVGGLSITKAGRHDALGPLLTFENDLKHTAEAIAREAEAWSFPGQ
ncbi:IclR family transcriptional regulator [Paracoccaceae bacterium GXU_MW_L88]